MFQYGQKPADIGICGLTTFQLYASISVPPRNLKVIRPSAWTVTVSMMVSQSFSSKSARASNSCTSNMNAPTASAFACRAFFMLCSSSTRVFAFSYRSKKPLYRAAYSSWFCAVCEFSAMQRFASSVTTSISSSRDSISASIPEQSVSVDCIKRQFSRALTLSARMASNAPTKRVLIVCSSRCGVSHLCSPLNLLLHCQTSLRYFEVEFQTLEPKKAPQSPQMMREEKMLFPLYWRLIRLRRSNSVCTLSNFSGVIIDSWLCST